MSLISLSKEKEALVRETISEMKPHEREWEKRGKRKTKKKQRRKRSGLVPCNDPSSSR